VLVRHGTTRQLNFINDHANFNEMFSIKEILNEICRVFKKDKNFNPISILN